MEENNNYSVVIEHLTKAYKIYASPWLRVLHAFSSKIPYKNFYAIKDLSVKIREGEAVGIVGKNGHGKSTLLKMITGVTRQTEGTIETKGRIVAMLELTSGFDKELTGMENIYIKARTIGMSKAQIESRIEDIARFADIGDYLYQPVRTYSSGMKSRLGFAVSVNLDPDILIVDEVLAVGDVSFQMKCLSKMEEFRKQGKTILFVSHNLSTVKAFCTSAMWIKDGILMDYGDTGIVVQEYQDYLKADRRAENERRRQLDEDLILTKDDMLHPSKSKLCNTEGDPQTVFECGEDICIFANYEVKVQTDDLVCAVTVYDNEGREIFGSDPHAERLALKRAEGKHKLILTLRHPELLPGHYAITCELWNTQSGFVRGIMSKKPFEIASDHFTGTGIVNIDLQCESR